MNARRLLPEACQRGKFSALAQSITVKIFSVYKTKKVPSPIAIVS